MALFRYLGSIHILSLLGLTTVTIYVLDTQHVALLTWAKIFSTTILSNSSLNASLKVTATLRVGCMTGFAAGGDLHVARACEASKASKTSAYCQHVVTEDCL